MFYVEPIAPRLRSSLNARRQPVNLIALCDHCLLAAVQLSRRGLPLITSSQPLPQSCLPLLFSSLPSRLPFRASLLLSTVVHLPSRKVCWCVSRSRPHHSTEAHTSTCEGTSDRKGSCWSPKVARSPELVQPEVLELQVVVRPELR